MTRIGVLGAGSHSSSNHGPSLAEYAARHPGEVELVAVCDRDGGRAQEYAARFGFGGTYTDLDRMLAEAGLDGVVAITAMEQTEELAGHLLRAGMPLVIEKPPGVGVEGARRLLAVARDTGTHHMVSLNRRFSPAMLRAQEWLARDGRTVRFIVSRMIRHHRVEPFFVRDTGIHSIDAVLSAMAMPRTVRPHGHRVEGSEARLFEARVTDVDDAIAQFLIAPDSGVREETMELVGRGFRVDIDFQHGAFTAWEGDRQAAHWEAAPEMAEYEFCGCVDETAAFIASLQGRRPWGPTMEEAVISMEVAVAVQEGRDADLASEQARA